MSDVEEWENVKMTEKILRVIEQQYFDNNDYSKLYS